MSEPTDMAPPPLIDGDALFLDFDGTLVELAETPDSIRVPAGLATLLGELARRLRGRLAIVSGRSISDLEAHLDCSGLAVSGSHGLELRLAGGAHIPLAALVDLGPARQEIASFAGRFPGLLVEDKPRSIALHFRKAPAEAERVADLMSTLAARDGLTVQHGKLVAELRPKGADKGDAVRALMTEPEFVGARPVFVGDDLTDEDAFETAVALGGEGILVGPSRPTAARWRLNDVDEVANWLKRAAAG